MEELPKAYNPNDHEQEIYKLWEESGAFTPKIPSKAEASNPDKSPFVISMPPPNVTGKLHIGHALFVTLEDIMTRYHRMKGEPTLWLPGTDHAGIATQSVVDKALRKKDINRFEIGREKFVEEVWKWKEEYGTEITRRLRRMGASCDWTRERFTLDEGLSEAVNEAFKRLYDKGLIYRGEYIVNWCPKCATAISDDEVEHKTQKTKLYFFKYDKDFPITIATTRPETKLGDTGVAVNPNDKRYKDYVGKVYEIDLDGTKRKIKVFADRAIDMKFGTGALGVTPAHSMTDWKMAEDHGLEKIKVIDERGKMTENAGKYAGLKATDAREKLVEYLRNNGLLEQEKEFENNLSICYRCGGAIEPLPSLQWFVKMKPLAEKAKKAVESGEIKIVPKRFEKVYFHWMNNIRDWCISRQLWWGHRIPVWYRRDANLKLKTMGFAGPVVPQVFEGKTKTYRLRDHELKIGDRLAFENSQTNKIFGNGKIVSSTKTKVKELPLNDSAHGATYEKIEELISAFKRHYPEKEITPETEAWIYEYEFNTHGGKSETEIFVGKAMPEGENWVQEDDVLDTWFSSGLWPFSTLGWPKAPRSFNGVEPKAPRSLGEVGPSFAKATVGKTPDCESLGLNYAPGITECDYNYFFPTTVLETGYDILFFWVARMIMMGIELTGKAPFKTVYLHGLVRDEQNRKMSKSLGNVLDPLDISSKFGTDAMRMALVVGTTAGADIAVGESKIKGYRNFANKIWNIARFVITNLDNSKVKTQKSKLQLKSQNFTEQDQKDLEKLQEVIKKTTKYLDEFKFSQAGELLYEYTWHEFADKIIEESKERLAGESEKDKQACLAKLITILIAILKLLHPFVPFVTEAIWQNLPDELKTEKLLISTKWPE